MKPTLVTVIVVALTGACSSPRPRGAAPLAPPPAALLLSTPNGIEVVSAVDGSVRNRVEHGVATADGVSIMATEGERLVVRNARTGAVQQTVTVGPGLVVSTVSADGHLVALTEPPTSGYLPTGRMHTLLVVVALPVASVKRFPLAGNLAPDAFSADGGDLFVVSYLPPGEPDRYQITSLGLASGALVGIFGREKETLEDMRGVAGTRVLAPDANTLYTLYLRPPPAGGAASGDTRPEIHTLKLDQGWAHCIDLPAGVGGRDLNGTALAASADGSRLFVVDRATRQLVEASTADLTILRSVSVPLTFSSSATVLAASGDDHLYLSDGPSVLVLSTATLAVVARWPVASPVTGLVVAAKSNQVLASRPEHVDVFAPSGRRLASTPVPSDATGIRRLLT